MYAEDRTKTIEVAQEMRYSDPRIIEFDTLESILNAIESGMGMSVVPKQNLNNRKVVQGINRIDLLSTVRIEFIVILKRKRTNFFLNLSSFGVINP